MAAEAEEGDPPVQLPPDALRRVFALLDWRSLAACARVSAAWRDVATEDALWRQQLCTEHRSPLVLLHTLARLPHNGTTSGAARQLLAAPTAADSGQVRAAFAAAKAHPAAGHQALLARCHAALTGIRAWRLVFTTNDAGGPRSPAVGHPSPLTAAALASGGWAVGCSCVCDQHQSTWLRFHLPAELKSDAGIAAMLDELELTCMLQALGPSGWFDVQEAVQFQIPIDDMAVLMQSHTTGFYCWDHAAEEPGAGVDRYDALVPSCWDATYEDIQQQQQPQQQQQQEEQQQQQEEQQQQQEEEEGQLPPPPSAAQLQPAGALGAAAGPDAAQAQQQQQQPVFELRTLAYVHYQQLLDMLPWRLPQLLPLPAAPGFFLDSAAISARVAPTDGPAFWLQLDFCCLHGGRRVGSLTVPLVLVEADTVELRYECVEDQLLVLVCQSSSSSSSTGDSTSAASSSSSSSALPAWLQQGSETVRAVFLGQRLLHGAASHADGRAVKTAADALVALMAAEEEVMTDFALFDGQGRLLLGRAGIELWSKILEFSQRPVARPPAETLQELVALRVGVEGRALAELSADEARQWDAHAARSEQRRTAQAAEAEGADTRVVQLLHFLVDGVVGAADHFWTTSIGIDPEGSSTLYFECDWPVVLGLMGARL